MTNTNEPTEVSLAPVNLEPIGDCRVLRDIGAQPGVHTVEGTLVPLLSGNRIRSHVIVLHAGQYLDAHPHDTESIIYTVSGRWVFCTTEDGEPVRTVIGPNDLFHFPADVPTGFETPFDEDATILILNEGSETREEMEAGFRGAPAHLAEEAARGDAFSYRELPRDHPARVYARQVAGIDLGEV
ncbi:MAG: cupin domain-containing protein [Actinomycetota bacterium]|nr:cupin domain-containing protein [Actinomycetota bacterium]